MPPVFVALAFAGAATAGAVAVGFIAAASAATFFAASFATTLVLGGLSQSMAKMPQIGGVVLTRDQTVTSKQPIGAHVIIYGRTRVGGTIVHMEATDSNKFLHLILAVAGHEIDAFEKVYFNDEELILDGNGIGYSGKARVQFKLGTANQTAFSDLVSVSTVGWSNDHRLRGRACAYIRLEFDQDVYPNGVPNISFLVRGKKVFDPRNNTTVWSANPALCLNDYMTNTAYGIACNYATEIDQATLIASANICDEAVDSPSVTKRYECNGTIGTDNAPQEIINSILSSMSGKAVWTNGKWRILAGAYYTPTLTFNESDLRNGFRVQSLISRRESFNSIKGVFSSDQNKYIVTDFPAIVDETFIAQDNAEKVFKDIRLPMTTDVNMARRLAKIELLKARQQITVVLPMKLQGLQANVGDIVRINNTRMGWSNKPFEVVSMTMALGEAPGVDLNLREIDTTVYTWTSADTVPNDPAPNTNLPNPFLVDPPANLTIAPTTRLALDGTVQNGLLVTWDVSTNAFVNQYEVQWIRGSSNFDWGLITDSATTTSNYGLIANTSTFEQDYGLITDATSTEEPQYNSLFVTNPYYFIPQAIAEVEYSVRARAINTLGVRSTFSTANNTTPGDTTAPLSPDGFSAVGGYREITLTWTNPTVSDFDIVEVYRNTTNNSAGATRIALIRSSSYVDSPLDINVTRYYWLKAVDRSGNVSDFSAVASATTQFINADSFSEEVMNLFSEAGAYGVEPVSSLPAEGDFDGQIKYQTVEQKLYRWDATAEVWTDDIFSIEAGSVDIASFASGIEPVGIVSSLPSPTGYTGAKIVFNTADNKLYRYTGTEWTSAIATTDLSGTLGASSFSNSLRPVEVVSSLPTTGNFAGRVVVLTSDNKLYRHTGSDWTAAVNTTDLSGTVQAAQIAALEATKITGQLTNAQIQELSTAKLTGTITDTQITNGAITDLKLASAAVTSAKLAVGAVTESTIAAGAITSTKITDSAITAPKISAGSITTEKIATGAITATTIAAGAITTDALAAGSIVSNKIAAGAVTATELSAGAVTTAKLAAGAVTADTIAANAITAAKVEAGAITTAKIAAGAIEADKIAASAVTAGKIAANAVETDKLAANAITTGKLAAGAVTADIIGANAVTTAKLAAGAVTAETISANSVIAGKIAAAAVSTTELAANAITADKIAVNAIIAEKIQAGAIQTDKIAANAITGGLIAASGVITIAAQINDAVITNAKIANLAVTEGKIADGAITNAKIDNTIASSNFVAGSTGWQIQKTGAAEFNNVVISRPLQVDTGDYFVGNLSDNNANTLDLRTEFFIETNTNTTAWSGPNETFLVLVGKKSGTGFGSVFALNSNVINQPQNVQWGWHGEVIPITRWSGNQRLWIKVEFYTRLVDRIENFTLTWRLYKVT